MIHRAPQSVTIKEGAVGQLDRILHNLHAKRSFFVVDRRAYEYSGAAEALAVCMRHREVTWFSEFEPNPKNEDVETGIALFRDAAVDVVVALGGGSALDMAKLMAGCGVRHRHTLM